jgi:NTP pyrophosphatase (non-canonical NTP hydrolase)
MIKQIHEQYGFKAMREVWIEELLELATILQKSKRHKVDAEDIISEVADVSFISEQMFYYYGNERCQAMKEFKMERTKNRLLCTTTPQMKQEKS